MSSSVQPPANPPSRTRLLLAVGTVAVLALAILLVAVYATGRKGGDTGDGVKPASAHSISAAANGRQQAKFEIVSGAEAIVVRCLDTGDDLYRASTPGDGRLVPQATTNGDDIQLTLSASGANGAASAEVILSNKVTWTLKLAGGGMSQLVDCGTGKIAGLELAQGAGTIDLTLPKPQGTVQVTLGGGAGTLKAHVATGPPVQVKVGTGAGAGTVSVDGQTKTNVKPGTDLTPATWNQATDRYTINAVAGLASLTVDRR